MYQYLNFRFLKLKSESSAAFYGILIFVIFLSVTQVISYQKYVSTKAEIKNEIIKVAEERKNIIQNILAENLSINRSLAYIVKSYGRPKNFNQTARSLIPQNNIINLIELTNKSIITDVYPYEPNKKVIGYDLFKNKIHRNVVIKTINSKDLYFEGPIKLIQGGVGIIGRYPFFDNHKFLGFSVVIIKIKDLIKSIGFNDDKNKLYVFGLSKKDPITRKEEFFLSKKSEFENVISTSVNIDSADWLLYVKFAEPLTYDSISGMIIFGFLFSIICGLFTWFILREPKKLGHLVKQKVKELKNHQYLLDQTQKLAKIGSWEVDMENQKAVWSDMVKEIHEVSLDYEITFDNFSEFYRYDEDILRVEKLFNLAITGEKLFDVDLEITTKKGNHKWIKIIGEPVLIDGNAIKFIGSLQDITSEKVATLQHQDLSRQLKEIGASIPGVIYQLKLSENKELSFHYMSDSSFNFFGLCPSNIYTSPQEFFKLLHPDDKDLFFDNLYKSAKDLKEYSLTFRVILNNETNWINVSAQPSLSSLGEVFWNGTFIDVTMVQKAEMERSYLAGLLENIYDAIISTDENFVIKSWNKGAVMIYGWQPHEVIGKRFQTVLKTQYLELERETIKQNFLRLGIFNGEVIQTNNKGEGIEILMNSALLKDKMGNITGSVTINKYIEDIKKSKKDSIYKTNLIATINKFNNDLINNKNWFNVLKNSLNVIGETIQVSRIYFYQLNYNNYSIENADEKLQWSLDNNTLTTNLYKNIPGNIVLEVLNLTEENSYFTDFTENLKEGEIKDMFIQKSIKSSLIFLIKIKDNTFGVLCFEDLFKNRKFTEDDIAFIKTISNNLSTAIEKADNLKKLKLAFEEKNSILESIGDAFFAIGKNWKINYFNKVAERLFRINKKEIIDKVIWGNLFEENDKIFYPQFKLAADSANAVHFEAYYAKHDIWIEVSVYPSEGGLAIYLKDITERVDYVNAIEKQNENLKEISWIQSHVVRAPLARLMGLINIKDTITDDEMTEEQFYNLIMKSANELDDAIKEITDKTQINSFNKIIEKSNR
jgi:PAS domain S-box-containing protein